MMFMQRSVAVNCSVCPMLRADAQRLRCDSGTIFGQGGGAGKVSTLLGMPAAQGLFHRAIAQSGSAVTSMPAATATQNAEALMSRLNLKANQAEDMQQLPVEQVLAAMAGPGGRGGFAAAPVVDGQVMASQNNANLGVIVRGIRREDLAKLTGVADKLRAGSRPEFDGGASGIVGYGLAAKLGARVGGESGGPNHVSPGLYPSVRVQQGS